MLHMHPAGFTDVNVNNGQPARTSRRSEHIASRHYAAHKSFPTMGVVKGAPPLMALATIAEAEEEEEAPRFIQDVAVKLTETELCLAKLRASRSLGPALSALKALAGESPPPEDDVEECLSKLREGRMTPTLWALHRLSGMIKDPVKRQQLASQRCRCEALLAKAAQRYADVPEVVLTAAELVLELVHGDTRRSLAGDSLYKSCQCVLDAHEDSMASACRKRSRTDSGSCSPRSVIFASAWAPVLQADSNEASAHVLEDDSMPMPFVELVPTAHTTLVVGRLIAGLFARRHSVDPCVSSMQVEVM